MDYQGIGRRIREARRLQGLSQEELAEKVDISVTHMSHIETGTTKLSLPVLVDIARVLNVSTDKLLRDQTDNLSTMDEISAAMEGCSLSHAQAIADIVKAARQALEKHI